MQAIVENQIIAARQSLGDKLFLAVSGGVDSVVLLHLLAGLADRFGLLLHVAHLDHQIRPESSADADFVRRLCDNLSLPCVVESCDVAALASAEGISLEMAGREARRAFLKRQADQVGARLIALAHHRDDQVETFLLRLLRGSGTAGLSAMQVLRGHWWRPLLDCSREQILTYARQNELAWVEDASNSDPAFLRNRIRHQLLPEVAGLNPQFAGRLAGLCLQLQVDQEYWQQQVAEGFDRLIVPSGDGLRLDRQKLLAVPEALRVRIVREAIGRVRGDLLRIEAVHLQAIEGLLKRERSQGQVDLPGCWVARRYETLWLRKSAPEPLSPYVKDVPVPGAVQLPCGSGLRAQLTTEVLGESAWRVEFDAAQITGSLSVRSWQAGDSFAPLGMAGTKKLKRLFSDQKVEVEARERIPLLVSGGKILWVAGLRRSGYAPVTEKTTEVLRVELVQSE